MPREQERLSAEENFVSAAINQLQVNGFMCKEEIGISFIGNIYYLRKIFWTERHVLYYGDVTEKSAKKEMPSLISWDFLKSPGKGAYSVVRLAYCRRLSKDVAVKIVDKR